MPASLFSEMERSGNGLQDERALQLALELSMLGLSSSSDGCGGSDGGSLGSHAAAATVVAPPTTNQGFDTDEPRMKKSQNMTECVPVPSSEHVAEIVGRQGCKIKALRAKTNTYIKTPVRGEEPVFVVTGRKEDVTLAKREILSAAEHFSQIRASRKSTNGSMAPGPPNPSVPGQSTIQVRVPYRVVGLVVGPKGATIKRIQQQTHTYIVTPSRDKEPVFEVTGLPENIDTARREIEAHIAMRTGAGMVDGLPVDDANDFHTNGIDSYTLSDPATPNNLVNSMYKGFGAFQSGSNNLFFSTSSSTTTHDSANIFTYPSATIAPSTSPTKLPDFTTGVFGGNSYDTDEGISESPTFDPLSLWSDFGSTKNRPRLGSISGTVVIGSKMQRSYSVPDTHPQSLTPDELGSQLERLPARRIRSAPLAIADDQLVTQENTIGAPPAVSGANILNSFGSSTSSSSVAGSVSSSPIDSSLGSVGTGAPPRSKRDCMVCFESSVVSALVPCGHNLFCMECAQRLCEKSDPICPVCHQPITQAIRIYS